MLLKYSEAKRWEDAKFEWHPVDIRLVDREDAETCACGHYPICEICVIKNDVNNTVLEVGNCCINQVSPEFDALRRIFPALRKGRINPAIINYAFKQGSINDWEKEFLLNVWRKHDFTSKQAAKFKQIRHKVYENIQISPKQRQAIYRKWGIVNEPSVDAASKEATAQ